MDPSDAPIGVLAAAAELPDAYRDRAKEFQIAALHEGVAALVAGPNVLRFAPALNITADEVTTGVGRLSDAIEKAVKK